MRKTIVLSLAKYCVAAMLAVFTAGQLYAAETFQEFLKRVESREPATKAISDVRDPKESIVVQFSKVDVKDGQATFEFIRRSKAGDYVARYEFPLSDEVSKEIKRLNNLREMQKLQGKVDAAMNEYRTFVASDFRIHVGDKLEDVDKQMGIGRKAHRFQGAWAGRTAYVYEDGLIVDVVDGRIETARRDQQ